MELPEPPNCPKRLREYLKLLRQAALTNRPIAGKGVGINEHPGQGTVVDADDCSPCP